MDQLVGNSRAETMWKIFDTIGARSATRALTILDRLVGRREPLGSLGGLSLQLHRLARAGTLAPADSRFPCPRPGRRPTFRPPGREQRLAVSAVAYGSALDWYWKLTWDWRVQPMPPRTLFEASVVQLARRAGGEMVRW